MSEFTGWNQSFYFNTYSAQQIVADNILKFLNNLRK